MDKKIMEAIARLIQKQVKIEVAKQTELIRAQIISEVAGMLNYSERKLLSKLNEGHSYDEPDKRVEPESDFQRSMKNLKSMDGYKNIVDKVEIPKKKQQFTTNSTLNDLLNETGGFTRDEIYADSPSFMNAFDDDDEDDDTREPWTNEAKIKPTQSQRAPENKQTPKTIMGTDHKPVNLGNETVQKVMNILNNTDFKAKYDEIAEAGNNFRDGVSMGGVQAPRYNSDYFDKTLVD